MNQSVINICIVIVAAIVLFVVLRFLNNQGLNIIPNVPINESFEASQNGQVSGVNMDNIGSDSLGDFQGGAQQPNSNNGTNTPQLTAQDLLPQNAASNTWANANPTGSGSLVDKNLLQAGHHIGINTVGQTLRNANLQLRSDPPNPQVKVSPWLQSTIDPDANRLPFEIGCSA
jgi:hypothetical protein